eukprot:12174396-Alexandrium_andersonii.AAC.1
MTSRAVYRPKAIGWRRAAAAQIDVRRRAVLQTGGHKPVGRLQAGIRRGLILHLLLFDCCSGLMTSRA